MLSVQRGFLCFYSDLNKQLHSRIYNPVIFHTGIFCFFFFFCKGSICIYLCPTVSCIHSKSFILFYFISFYMQKALCASFANNMNICSAKKTLIVCSATLKWSLVRVCWQCVGEFGHKEGFCTKYFLFSLVISLVTLSM